MTEEVHERAPHLISDLNGSPLKYTFLSDEEASRLYRLNPDLPKDYELGCPTCQKRGTYKWKGEDKPCDCQDQLNRHKNYLAAGIGYAYQILDWEDYHSDPGAIETLELYLSKYEEFIRRGVGLIFHGDFGLGKSMAAQLLLKELVMRGENCYFTTLADMIDMFTAGWRSEEERVWYQKKIRGSKLLVVDDVGKELKTKIDLPEATFDSVLRGRVREGKPTLLTMNLSLSQLGDSYGAAIFSLLSENSVVHEFKECVDYRPQARSRAIEEVKKGIVRPIF